jgi:aminoglycoside phosphotransferase (APT) family kinase protein
LRSIFETLFLAVSSLMDVGVNAVTGIIDWSDAAIADPARDLALIYRDLGPEVFELTVTHYARYFDDADREGLLSTPTASCSRARMYCNRASTD